ncbi:DJ-1 family glyoxalase III [Anaerovorax odorimutans]|uniref:DJ-1 family glyoxalase III n=1 Tax=Anaerovorax odorimutans TaxID=109327 RepID=UPI000401583E|nr:DJ-1 family glyoxalase III [Anaerovorax odorimutans]
MVYVHLADGFEEIEAVTIVDVLRRAGIETKTISIMSKKEVTGAHGMTLSADILFREADYEKCEMIVLPGGMPGTTNLGNHKGLTENIKYFAKHNKWIAAICAAPMILGQLGLLEGKDATIYVGMESYLTGANYSEKKVVVDGNIITSKGPATAAAFALELVTLLLNKNSSDKVKEGMLIE